MPYSFNIGMLHVRDESCERRRVCRILFSERPGGTHSVDGSGRTESHFIWVSEEDVLLE